MKSVRMRECPFIESWNDFFLCIAFAVTEPKIEISSQDSDSLAIAFVYQPPEAAPLKICFDLCKDVSAHEKDSFIAELLDFLQRNTNIALDKEEKVAMNAQDVTRKEQNQKSVASPVKKKTNVNTKEDVERLRFKRKRRVPGAPSLVDQS
ncbi:hypothetical protein GUITHDRAFT_147374 [Guillardia theta CCMP2712]|uniref:Uncharacterized protein n=1 Tax=Guillardia theta (strain CCMP2712) TaxID=905079 RepID=L1IED4_GUITC|nr:hypothetical protein GUITHDRAFT_147374 [Guillardia theta CCMP2712]EKX34190.1 hypothetical protein GUITHDRAFT_147374 [Guillardia theta CCMP2712]|eukprot:XP_005821170.1 hypothetical protein GUITHDRAFT_147374 [Guillardia theta CCMP2712]